MKQLKSTSVYIDGEVHRAVKMRAAQFGVRWGDAVAAMLAAFDSMPLEAQARAMAACDSRAGELVPDDMTETEYLEQVRALAAVPARVEGEEF